MLTAAEPGNRRISLINCERISLPHNYGIAKEFDRLAVIQGPGCLLASGVLHYRKYFTLFEERLKSIFPLIMETKSIDLPMTIAVYT